MTYATRINKAIEAITFEQYDARLKSLSSLSTKTTVRAWGFPGPLGAFVREVKTTLAKLADLTGESFDALLSAFRSKDLFNILKAVGFSFKKLYAGVQSLLSLVPKGLMLAFSALRDTRLVKALRSGAVTVDSFLNEHPTLRKLVGPAMAGLLLWIWLNSAFTGDPAFDLDVTSIIAALSGKFSIEQLFASDAGSTSLALFAAGFSGIGVAWLGTSVANFILALLFTGAKAAKDRGLAQSLKDHIQRKRIHASLTKTMKRFKTKASGALDAVRGGALLNMIGVKGAELQDSSPGVLVFSVVKFDTAYRSLAEFYGKAKNESNAGWVTKRLVWSVPEVNGLVALVQIGNSTPLVLFKQL